MSTGLGHTAENLPPDLVPITDAWYAQLEGLAGGRREAQQRQRQAVEQLGLPLEVKTRQTGIVFRLIPAGTFTMGSPTAEDGRNADETQHRVTLNRPFYCGKFEVTQGQWEAVMGANPSCYKRPPNYQYPANFKRDNAPVECVSWDDCRQFCRKLCAVEAVAQDMYRLLTEAQWEYACRA